jgi:hypothetical protein
MGEGWARLSPSSSKIVGYCLLSFILLYAGNLGAGAPLKNLLE